MTYSIIFIFIDGLGLGLSPDTHNPLATLTLPAFERLAGSQCWTLNATPVARKDHVFHPIDATLGVPGLPQSGTGQATLFTGVNCARLAGRHFGPYPPSKTRRLLASDNLFHQVQALGLPFKEPAAFANAYPDRFFAYMQRRDRWTVTTRCCLDAGLRIRTHEDLLSGRALAADLTARTWPQPDASLMPISTAEAGKRLVCLGENHALLLFEHFQTDKIGHRQSFDEAEQVLYALDGFFEGILDHLDPTRQLLLITSDHGNLEDLSTKSHTVNPVPLVAYGQGAAHFASATDLTGVTPALIHALRASSQD